MGRSLKTATLYTNDPARPKIVLSLNANVLRATGRAGVHIGPIFIEPFTKWMVSGAPGQRVQTEIFISSDKEPVKIVRVEGGKVLNARIETLEPGKRYRLLLEATLPEKGDVNADRMTVFTDSATLPSFPLHLTYAVRSGG